MGGLFGGGGGGGGLFTETSPLTTLATGGLNQVDMATGSHVGSAISQYNPLKKANPEELNKMGPAGTITAPTLPPGLVAPKVAGTTIAGTAGPTAAQIGMIPQNQFRDQQMALAQQLNAQAMGTGPSVAGNAFQSATEANLAATLAAANSARGGANPGLQRAAMQANAETQGRMATDLANARLQEQMQAAGVLGGIAGQARNSDINLATSQAGLNQQAGLAGYQGNLQTNLAQGQVNANAAGQNAQLSAQYNALVAQYASMGLDAAKANQMAALQVQMGNNSIGNQNIQMNNQAGANQSAAIWNALQAAGGAASGFGTMFGGGGGATPAGAGQADPAAFAPAPTGISPAGIPMQDAAAYSTPPPQYNAYTAPWGQPQPQTAMAPAGYTVPYRPQPSYNASYAGD